MLFFKPFFLVRRLRLRFGQQRFFRSCAGYNCAGKFRNNSADFRTDDLRANDCCNYCNYYNCYNYYNNYHYDRRYNDYRRNNHN